MGKEIVTPKRESPPFCKGRRTSVARKSRVEPEPCSTLLPPVWELWHAWNIMHLRYISSRVEKCMEGFRLQNKIANVIEWLTEMINKKLTGGTTELVLSENFCRLHGRPNRKLLFFFLLGTFYFFDYQPYLIQLLYSSLTFDNFMKHPDILVIQKLKFFGIFFCEEFIFLWKF